jgi:uncharacterized iron-regulated membrane protein
MLTAADVDAMAAAASRELPGLRIAGMLTPTEPGDPLVFQGYTDSTWLVRRRASYVAFDPQSGKVLSSHRSRDAGLHQRISEMADPLHFGYFGGLAKNNLVRFRRPAVDLVDHRRCRLRKTRHPGRAAP